MQYDQPTRYSLIARLQDVDNQAAWDEFVELYGPMIRRIAGQLQFQPADVEDATQEVLMHLTRAVEKWDPTKDSGSFRGWLYRVARNVMIRWLRGKGLPPAGTYSLDEVSGLVDANPEETQTIWVDLEMQRQLFAAAAERVRHRFQETTWSAFWQTVVKSKSISSVAADLGISEGNVYVARSRVMNRVREEVRRLVDTEWEPMAQSGYFRSVDPNAETSRISRADA